MFNEELEAYVNEVKETIQNAQEALLEIKITRENDPSQYSFAMKELLRLEANFPGYYAKAGPDEKEILLEAKEQLEYTKDVMDKGI